MTNQKQVLAHTTALASTAETARAALIAHVTAICEGASEGFVRDVRVAATTGFIAGMLATKANRAVKPEDIAAAAVILAKGSKASPDEAKLQNAARQRWHQVMEKAREASPAVATKASKSAAKATAAKATAAKRKARAASAGITISKGRISKADGTGMTPTTNPAVPTMPGKAACVAHLHQNAALMLAFVEKNTKALGADATKQAKAALASLMKISAA